MTGPHGQLASLQFHRACWGEELTPWRDEPIKYRSIVPPNSLRQELLCCQNFGRAYLEKNEAISINPALQKRFAVLMMWSLGSKGCCIPITNDHSLIWCPLSKKPQKLCQTCVRYLFYSTSFSITAHSNNERLLQFSLSASIELFTFTCLEALKS